jgi:hypothetical protein
MSCPLLLVEVQRGALSWMRTSRTSSTSTCRAQPPRGGRCQHGHLQQQGLGASAELLLPPHGTEGVHTLCSPLVAGGRLQARHNQPLTHHCRCLSASLRPSPWSPPTSPCGASAIATSPWPTPPCLGLAAARPGAGWATDGC